MKKILKVIICVVMIMSSILMLAACSGKESTFTNEQWKPPVNYVTDGDVVDDLNAFDFFVELIERKESSRSHYVYSVRDFRCKSLGSINNDQLEVWYGYADGDKWFTQTVCEGTGIAAKKQTGYKKFYYDGTKGYHYEELGANVIVDLTNPDFTGKSMTEYDSSVDVRAVLQESKEFTSYRVERGLLSTKHDDRVYELDDAYYFSITFGVVGTNGVQSRVEEVIKKNLDMAGELTWDEDTVITCKAEKIDGVWYMTAREMIECYSGKASGLSGVIYQNTSAVYAYNDSKLCTITAEMVA